MQTDGTCCAEICNSLLRNSEQHLRDVSVARGDQQPKSCSMHASILTLIVDPKTEPS
jgi:hypothetical protein